MAALMDNKKVYDFQVFAPSVLGTSFKRVEIVGHFPYESAIIFQGDLDAIHAEVYSTGNLPVGTPNDPRQYEYFRIKKPDGTFTIIGEAWIDPASIQEVLVKTAHVTIPNASTGDLVRLRTMLSQAGYIDFTISFD